MDKPRILATWASGVQQAQADLLARIYRESHGYPTISAHRDARQVAAARCAREVWLAAALPASTYAKLARVPDSMLHTLYPSIFMWGPRGDAWIRYERALTAKMQAMLTQPKHVRQQFLKSFHETYVSRGTAPDALLGAEIHAANRELTYPNMLAQSKNPLLTREFVVNRFAGETAAAPRLESQDSLWARFEHAYQMAAELELLGDLLEQRPLMWQRVLRRHRAFHRKLRNSQVMRNF